MMKVMRISGTNIKGSTFSDPLGPVTCFHGENFAGKSTRAEALLLALAGWLPGVEKTPSKILDRLSSGSIMNVQAKLDDGSVIERQWAMQRGSVKSDGPEGWPFPAVAVDAESEFLGLSGPARVKFLFGSAKLPPEFSVQGMAAAIAANVKNIKLEANTEASEAAIREVVRVLDAPSGVVVANPQEWLSALAETVRQRKLAADQNVRRMAQTQQGLTQIENPEPAPQDADAQLKAARERWKAAVQAKAAADMDVNAKSNALDQLVMDRDAFRGVSANEAVEDLESQLNALESVAIPPQGNYQLQVWNESTKRLTAALDHRNSVMRAIEKLTSDIAESKKEKTCPTCGQPVAAKSGVVKSLQLQLSTMKKELPQAEEKLAEMDVAAAQAKQQYDGYEQARQNALEAHQKAAQIRAKLKSMEDRREKERLAAAKHKAALLAIPDAQSALDDALKAVESATVALNDAAGVVLKWEQASRRLMAERAEAASRAKARQEAERCKAEAQVWKATVSIVQELTSMLVEKTVGPVVQVVNELCGGILRGPLAIQDGDLVMEVDGQTLSWRTFSGTERALAFAALRVALAPDAPVRLVVIDELGRLSRRNKTLIADRLVRWAESGRIDNAVLIDVEPLQSSEVLNIEVV